MFWSCSVLRDYQVAIFKAFSHVCKKDLDRGPFVAFIYLFFFFWVLYQTDVLLFSINITAFACLHGDTLELEGCSTSIFCLVGERCNDVFTEGKAVMQSTRFSEEIRQNLVQSFWSTRVLLYSSATESREDLWVRTGRVLDFVSTRWSFLEFLFRFFFPNIWFLFLLLFVRWLTTGWYASLIQFYFCLCCFSLY